VESLGVKAEVVASDIADADRVETAAAQTEKRSVPIGVRVDNATAPAFSRVVEMTPGNYKRVTETTYFGYVHHMCVALKRMLPVNRGINVLAGSVLAYRRIPLQSVDCAAKHAIRGFNNPLRGELNHDHSSIKVTMVQMPDHNTPNLAGLRAPCGASLSQCRPFFSLKSSPVPSSTRLIIIAASGTLAAPQRRLLWATR